MGCELARPNLILSSITMRRIPRRIANVTIALLVGVISVNLLDAQRLTRGRVASSPPAVDYFPLEEGNSWTYAITGFAAQGSVSIRVTRSVAVNGITYHEVEGYTPEPVLLRRTRSGQIVELQTGSGTEQLWYDFGAPPGSSWHPGMALDCLGTASLSKQAGSAETPAGVFDDVVSIDYRGTNCADAGMQEEVFAAGVGLIRRTSLTIGGPRSLVLVEASLGTGQIPGQRISVSLSIDKPAYTADLMPPVSPDRAIPIMHAAFKVANTSDQPLRLTTPSGQEFDLVIKNAQGDVIYRWSDGKFFTQAASTIDLSPGHRTYAVEIPLSEAENQPLAPGKYTVESWLAVVPPESYRATTSFEIQHVF